MKLRSIYLLILAAAAQMAAADDFSLTQCEGSRMPYPTPDSIASVPDSLTPVIIYHVGRHGARYATSPKRFTRVAETLRANSESLTPEGHRFLAATEAAISASEGRWGALDSLGAEEQRGIARRMCEAFPGLIRGGEVTAVSSVVERCVQSMDAFAETVRRAQGGDGKVTTASGNEFSPLMRPFAIDPAYREWARLKPYSAALEGFTALHSPGHGLLNLLMKPEAAQKYSAGDAVSLCADIYYTASSLQASGFADAEATMGLLTEPYANDLWEIDNLRQYFSRTSTTLSSLPAEIANPLLLDMIEKIDEGVSFSADVARVQLHFGHAETLMPLLSLMQLPGCYYHTEDYSTVKDNWQTFHVVPMAANLQVIAFISDSGRSYVRLDLNERPLTINGCVYQSWPAYRSQLLSLLMEQR